MADAPGTEVVTLVRDLLAEHLPSDWKGIGALSDEERDDFLVPWRKALREHRLLAYSWPAQYGGGGGSLLDEIAIHEECARAGVPVWSTNDHFGIQMLGNTLLRRGSEEQCRRFLPRILSGEDVWCQGYSEPDAGSDLAALRCTAVLDGDEWVIDGQKTWTSAASSANWIFVLARTDRNAANTKGISFLLVPMDQPGIEARELMTIAGSSDFSEVFFTGARTATENTVGPLNEGWSVAMTLLGFERGAEAGILYIQFREELSRLIELARERGRITEPTIRQRLASAHAKVEVLRFLGLKAVGALAADREPGAGAAITKLYWSEYHQELTALALDILEGEALTPLGRPSRTGHRADEPGTPNASGTWIDVYLKAKAGTIYAGTSEIQRNTIATRILGLPR
jgi:alkylation response protein AidB-like acyl-CoA dehydrogenase